MTLNDISKGSRGDVGNSNDDVISKLSMTPRFTGSAIYSSSF